MSTQTGSISFEAAGGFNSYAKANYATLSQIKGQFATCGTGAATAAKVATIVPTDSGWTLYDGATITVKFTSKNTAENPTLNVNGTGAKPIKDYAGNDLTQVVREWPEGTAMALTYDGSFWRIQDSDLMERVSSAETAIEQNANNISLNASKLETVANPNLSPFFSINTVYKSSDGSGYWQEFRSLYSLLDDGWAHVSSEGFSGTYFTQHVHRAMFSSFEAGTYTLLTELRNIEAVGSITYTVLNWAASMVPPSTQPDGFIRSTTLTEDSNNLIMRTVLTCDPEYSTNTRGVGFTFEGIASGESISADIRLSLYKGEYTGPWKPYSGGLLYASQAELKIANDNISSKVSTTDYNGETVTSLINQSADSVKIQAKHVDIQGTITAINNNTTTTIDGGKITTGSVTAEKIDVTDLQAIGATIGGFQIDADSVHTKNVATTSNADNSIALSSADFTRTINSTSRAGLRFAMGDKFGVTGDGTIYASNVDLTGKITATSGTIGGASIDSSGKLQVPAAQITGNLSADRIKTNVVSAINATANKIDAKNIDVSAINIGDLAGEIGGRNLLGNTSNPRVPDGVQSTASMTFGNIGLYNRPVNEYSIENYDDTVNSIVITSSATGNVGVSWYTKPGEVKADEEYTFSCKVKSNVAISVHTHTAWRNGSSTAGYTGWTSGGSKSIDANTWTDYSFTFKPATNAQLNWEFMVSMCFTGISTGVIFYVTRAKFEKGSKATDWTPAPEDVNSMIDDASKIASNYITHIDNNGIKIHPQSGESNRVSIDGSAIWMYRNNYLKAKYGDTITLYGGSNASGANPKVELTSTDFKMTDSGGTQRLLLNSSSGAIIGHPSKGRTQITDAGITVYDTNSKVRSIIDASGLDVKDTDGSTSVALFAASSRIGKAASGHVIVDSTGMTVYDASNKKRTAVNASGLTVYDASEVDVGNFGSTVGTTGTTAFARIGKSGSSRFEISPTTLSAYSGTTKYFEVSANGLTWGSSNTAATTAQVSEANNAANTIVTVYPTAIDYAAGTATLAVKCMRGTTVITPSVWKWTKGTSSTELTANSDHTLTVTDLNAVYNCTVTISV